MMLLAVAPARATIIVNLSANPSDPNAGNSSGSYPYNPVIVFLAAGDYEVSVAGISGGGQYDAYTVYAPTPTNGAYTDDLWSVAVPAGATLTEPTTYQFNTAAAALAYYSALVPLFVIVPEPEDVAFYLDDEVYPYFGDDAGGVSLKVVQVDIPEPGAVAILGGGLIGLAVLRGMRGRRRAGPERPPPVTAPRSSP